MHPIEHLRHIARVRGVDAAVLVRETAVALGSLRADPANLVIACRRIVQRHVAVAPMWWLCAQLLTAEEPAQLAWELADAIDSDPTADRLAETLAVQLPGAATVLTVGHSDAVAAGLIERFDVAVWCADSGHAASSLMQRLERAGVVCEPVPPDAIGNAVAVVDVVLIEALAAAPHRVLVAAGTLAVAAAAYVVGTPIWLVAPLGVRVPAEYVDAIARVALDSIEPLRREFDDLPTDMIARVVTADGDFTPADGLASDVPFAPELLRAADGTL